MSKQMKPGTANEIRPRFNLGTFEGFNFKTQSAICRILTASQVIYWDHDREGEAEFWPAGDRPEVSLLFRHECVTGSELLDLDRLLNELGDDSADSFLRIHHARNGSGFHLADLTREKLDDLSLYIYFGSNFTDVRKEAAYDLFENFYPEEYTIWEKSHCDGLIFDTDHFLNSPSWWTQEIKLGDMVALLVSPQ
jgi:hypothetical protein